MKAMIFAAGEGTRLRPLTQTMPKALVPVAGKPLLGHVIGKLREAGYTQLVVNVHHFPGQIREYLASKDWGVEIQVSDESEALLETGGAILHARKLLLPSDGPFLVHNVDILSNLDLQWVRENTAPEALATLIVSPRETRRQLLFGADMRLLGWTDTATGEVRSPFPGLDPAKCRRYAFTGIHNIAPRIFPHFEQWGFAGRFPIMDFYLKRCAGGRIFGLLAEDLKILDAGKPESLAQAESFCKNIF